MRSGGRGELVQGDVVAIPVDGRFFACKVIWISRRTKDVVGLVALGSPFDQIEAADPAPGPYRSFTVMGQPAVVLYGDKKNITKRGLWPRIGHLPVEAKDADLIRHRVGNSLYQGDEFLQNVSGPEAENYPKMVVAGNTAIELFLRQSKLPD